MSGEIRLQPFGNEEYREYRVLIMGRIDDRLSVFATMGRGLLNEYSSSAIATLSELGYQGDQNHPMQAIAVGWYAQVCGNPDVPRTVLWHDDPKPVVLSKLRDVVCYQRWGKTVNQYPKVQEIFSKLNFGVVAEDPIGYARGAAVRALIAASYDREIAPIVYFDEMRRYPVYVEKLLLLLERFEIEEDDIEKFDPNFGLFMLDRFNAAMSVLEARKPEAKPWENWPLSENPIWQKYINDWDDYQSWLDKKD